MLQGEKHSTLARNVVQSRIDGVGSPIVTSRGRGNAENKGVKVELPEAGILGPLDPLELGRLLLGGGRRLRVRLLFVEDAHVDHRMSLCRAWRVGIRWFSGEMLAMLFNPSPWDP